MSPHTSSPAARRLSRSAALLAGGFAEPLALLVALLLAGSAVLLGALPAGAASGTPAGQAWVRAGHLVPGLGAARIDLLPSAGGSSRSVPMSPSAAYGDVTKYRQLTPGSYLVQVRLAGSTLAAAPMLSRSLTVVANQAYTLAVLGTHQAPRLATLSDDLTPPAANDARVRVLPAASQAREVTVQAKNGPTIAENAVLGQASGYTSVPAGTWHLQTTHGSGRPVSSSITVASGSVYTLLVLDGTHGRPRLDLITDAAGTSAAPKGGAATGGGGMATQFVGTAPSTSSSQGFGGVRLAVLAAGLLAAGLLAAGGPLLRRGPQNRPARS